MSSSLGFKLSDRSLAPFVFLFQVFHDVGKVVLVADFVPLSPEVNDTTRRIHHLHIVNYLLEVLLQFSGEIFG